jgi:hypothetical protein
VPKFTRKITDILKPKPYVPEPTIEQHLNATNAQAAAALSFFEASAADLADAALQQDAIAGLLYDQAEALEAETAKKIAELYDQADSAVVASVQNTAAADRIRDLVGQL